MSRTSTQFKSSINHLKCLVFFSFDGIQDYIKLTKKSAETIDNSIEQRIRLWDEENKNEHFSGFDIFESDYGANGNYKQYAQISSLLVIQAEFENTLRVICRDLREVLDIRSQLGKKPNLCQLFCYISKEVNLKYTSEMGNLKAEILAFSVLRNIVAHNGGYHSEEEKIRKQDKESLKRISNYVTDGEDSVQYGEEAVNRFLLCCDRFVDCLLEHLCAEEEFLVKTHWKC